MEKENIIYKGKGISLREKMEKTSDNENAGKCKTRKGVFLRSEKGKPYLLLYLVPPVYLVESIIFNGLESLG